MENRAGEVHVDTDEARSGSTPNIVRWVLGIGLLLAIIGLSLAWIIPAVSHGDETLRSQNANENIQAQRSDEGASTDSMITAQQAGAAAGDEAGVSADNTAPDEGAVPAVEN